MLVLTPLNRKKSDASGVELEKFRRWHRWTGERGALKALNRKNIDVNGVEAALKGKSNGVNGVEPGKKRR